MSLGETKVSTSEIESEYEFEWPKAYWIGTAAFLVIVVPAWACLGSMMFPGNPFATATGSVLLVGLLASAYTDMKWRLIPNWFTYSAILFGFALNLVESYTLFKWNGVLGGVGISECLVGFAILFVGLLVIFSFSGGGAGDVKLVGAIGALLGFVRGTEAVCVSFIACAVLSVGWELRRRFPRRAFADVESEQNEKMMGLQIPLAPFFALGTFLVLLRDVMIEQPEMFQFVR